MSGIFITFEGIEGAGKSTQVQMLGQELQRRGFPLFLTREPGGTAIGDQIRTILLETPNPDMQPETEALLLAASRMQHVTERIRPALAEGRVVICDRYSDSSLAYQGYGRGVPVEDVAQMIRLATRGCMPERTLLLDLPVSEGLSRAHHRNLQRDPEAVTDRFEGEGSEFHLRVREGYLALARAEPERFRVFDARLPKEELAAAILAAVLPALDAAPTADR